MGGGDNGCDPRTRSLYGYEVLNLENELYRPKMSLRAVGLALLMLRFCTTRMSQFSVAAVVTHEATCHTLGDPKGIQSWEGATLSPPEGPRGERLPAGRKHGRDARRLSTKGMPPRVLRPGTLCDTRPWWDGRQVHRPRTRGRAQSRELRGCLPLIRLIPLLLHGLQVPLLARVAVESCQPVLSFSRGLCFLPFFW